MDNRTNEIVGILPNLPNEDLDYLAKMIGTLRGSSQNIDIPDEYHQLWDAFLQATIELYGAGNHVPPLNFSLKHGTLEGLDAASHFVDQVLKQAEVPRGKKKILRAKICHFCATYLVSYLNAIGVPVGPKTLLQHAHKIPALMNKKFPGYFNSGLLGLVLVGKFGNNT